MNIEYDIRSGQSIVYFVSPEEARAELHIIEIAKKLKRPIHIWSHTDGITRPLEGTDDTSIDDPVEALLYAKSEDEKASKGEVPVILLFKDLHAFLNTQASATIIRHLRDIARNFKQAGTCLVILAPRKEIPQDLERDMVVRDLDLPDEKTIAQLYDGVIAQNKAALKKHGIVIDDDERQAIISGARGLTTDEVETAIARAIVERSQAYKGDPEAPAISKLVLKEKAEQVKKTGILEYFEATETTKDVGGLSDLKAWLRVRKNCFGKKAKEYGLPNPKGILLAGPPGCGKSLVAKATSNIFGIPLIKFEISRLLGGIVGMSETNTRNALKIIDAVGTCVVWIDEMEKAFAGMGSSNTTDSGVTQRIFGMILTWMQEKTSPSFIIATVNNTDSLPSELIRKGRLDEIFYVPLPSFEERLDIINIHIKGYDRDPKELDQKVLKKCAEDSAEFSGSELKAAVESALYYCFYKNKELHADAVWGSIQQTNPLAKSRKAQIDSMKKWAAEFAVPASPPPQKDDGAYKRKLFLGDE